MSFLHDLKIAVRSLARARALWITVALTLALGIGANAAIFSVVRAVLLRPLANRDENRLLYLRQSAPGLGVDNTTFSVPEIQDIGSRLKTIQELGTFSEIDFTVVGLGTPREVQAGVVDGNYFEVMGLRPVLGRLLTRTDDGPNAAGAIVLTNRFWTNSLHSDASVLGKTVRLESAMGARSAVIVGVLEPSVPYPVETELIANIVTSPHHLSATMVTGREHRMTEVFGRLASGADLDSARAELRTTYAAMLSTHPETYKAADHYQIDVTRIHDQINSRANTILWVLFAASGLLFVIACSNVANLVLARTVRRESELAVRSALGASTAALRRSLLAESIVLCGSGALASRRPDSVGRGRSGSEGTRAFSRLRFCFFRVGFVDCRSGRRGFRTRGLSGGQQFQKPPHGPGCPLTDSGGQRDASGFDCGTAKAARVRRWLHRYQPKLLHCWLGPGVEAFSRCLWA